METAVLKELAGKDNWLIVTIFVLYLAFKILMSWMENRKAKTKEQLLEKERLENQKLQEERHNALMMLLKALPVIADNSRLKDSIIDSIERKLKIIYNQYGSELSKESAISVIQNIYFNFATQIANEIYELQKLNSSHDKIVNHIKNSISIINDEKMQELDTFMYRDRHLITYTTGEIISYEKIINVINSYSDKNGMLRKELEDLLNIESGIVIKRL